MAMQHVDLKKSRYCPLCNKLISRANWSRHARTHKQSSKYVCDVCGATYNRPDNLAAHKLDKHHEHDENLPPTEDEEEPMDVDAPGVSSPVAVPDVATLGPAPIPIVSHSDPLSDWFHEPKLEIPQAIWDDVCHFVQLEARPMVHANWDYVRSYMNERDPNLFQYNYRLVGMHQMGAREYFKWIFEHLGAKGRAFKIKASLHVLLKHKTKKDVFKFFYASNNNYTMPLTGDVEDGPAFLLVDNEDKREQVLNVLSPMTLANNAALTAPDTEWQIANIIGIHFWICPMHDLPIGAPNELPKHLKQNHNLHTYRYDSSRNYYDDNLCAFRFVQDCLHDCGGFPNQRDVLKRFNEFMVHIGKGRTTPNDFGGIVMDDLDAIEDCFKIRIKVYSMEEDEKVRLLRWSSPNVENPHALFHANIHKTKDNKFHMSRIVDLAKFAKCFFCDYCQQEFSRADNVEQHIKKDWCTRGQTKFEYPGGKYEATQSIFMEMEEIGIVFDDCQDRFYEYRAIYDTESILRPLKHSVLHTKTFNEDEDTTRKTLEALNFEIEDTEGPAPKLQIVNDHVPLTFSVVSNIPGHEEPCIETNPNTEELVDTFVNVLEEMSAAACGIMQERFASQIAQLDAMLKEAHEAWKVKEKEWRAHFLAQEEYTRKDKPKKIPQRRGTPDRNWLNKLVHLKSSFNNWMNQLPVIGFNSSNYDLPLLREYLYPKLVSNARDHAKKNRKRKCKSFDERMMRFLKLNVHCAKDQDDLPPEEEEEEEDPFAIPENKPIDMSDIPTLIKQGSGIMCLSTKTLKFLDLNKYLGAGTSLDKFLKSWEKNDKILSDQGKEVPFGMLKSTKIPFPYSFLNSVEKLKHVGVPPKSAFKNHLRLEQISKKEYKMIVDLYAEKKFETFKDYLHYYVMLDTVPLLQAVNKMFKLTWDLSKIDMFKECMSLPGLTLISLARETPNFDFSLFSQYDEALYNDLKSGLTGGLSVVNNRYGKVGETFIRGNPLHILKEIFGLDFNAMYLAATGRPMPTGFYVHWVMIEHGPHGPYLKRASSNQPEASVWLDYLRNTLPLDQQNIIHAKRNGYEKRCGPRQIPADGLDIKNRIVYEYTGCFWHCHDPDLCSKNVHTTNPRTKRTVEQCAKELKERTEYLESLGYTVVIKWECEWLREKKDPTVQSVLDTLSNKAFQNKWSVSHNAMLNAIQDDSMFGFAKVDIHTPDHLKEFFSDFPPVIKKADITIDDIGDYMKEWCVDNEEMKRPCNALIGSYFGKGVWLMTPMIKYLLEKGLIVTKIEGVIQYEKAITFDWFCNRVTDARRKGDEAPELSMIGDMEKLRGNSAYGKTITALQRHRNVGLIGKEHIRAAINDPFLDSIDPLGDAYEVSFRPRKKKMNLPIQIGLAVYQYSKMYMMQFAWDVLGTFMDRSLYDWMNSDTDSIYLMSARETLDELVLPEKREEWDQVKHLYMVIDEKKDKRTPGLLKVEYKGGEEMVCLRAKMYAICGKDENKLSSSGLMKRTNDLTVEEDKKVIDTGLKGSGINVGFMKKNNKIQTYVQERSALSNLYVKRKVLSCGKRTVPLDL